MTTARTYTKVVLVAAFTYLAVFGVPAVEAQQDEWSIVFTPQLWMTNVAKNGFAATGQVRPLGLVGTSAGPAVLLPQGASPLPAGDTDATSTLFPQWGGQIAGQYGRWTFGAAAQFVSFETRTHFFTNDAPIPCLLIVPLTVSTCSLAPAGQKFTTETIRTDRLDVDITASYFFPDVIKDWMDLSLGIGFKWIHADGHRTLSDNDTFFTPDYQFKNGTTFRNKASFSDNLYGATLPTTANIHLGASKRWFLPITLNPFFGYEDSKDQVVGDKSSFAIGGTLDVGIRYVFANGIAVYGGYRAQAIDGVNLYVAHGPLINMSVRFGGP
jgi:hypothetical protein